MIKTNVLVIDDWQVEPFSVVPIGKRVKRTVTNENDEIFYFKEPEPKYPWEFWTEIAASKLGQLLGFEILDYNIGVYQNSVGCISKSMIALDDELIHGQQFLTQLKPNFDKKRGSDHSFQILESLFLNNHFLINCFDKVLAMIVYDAIVGNRDRHQQNWAIIRKTQVLDASKFWYFNLKKIFWRSKNEMTYVVKETNLFSPLFDNGNCLAYNITNEMTENMIKDDNLLSSYAFGKKATSHIRWGSKNITHFELIDKVSQRHRSINKIINRTLENYNKDIVREIIWGLDKSFDSNQFPRNKLHENRKELMIKLVDKRIQKLQETKNVS